MEIIDRKTAKAKGLTRYFTGKPCKHGHVTERHIHNSTCVACINNNALEWARGRRSYLARKRAIWRKTNPEREKINRDRANKLWYAKPENRLRAITLAKKRYLLRRLEIAAQRKSYRIANKELLAARMRAWYEKNTELAKTHARNRKARKRGNGGSHTAADIADLYRLQGGRCACGCREPLTKKYHVDHIVPVISGGRNDKRNLQLLRPECNLSKGPKDPLVFYRERGLLL